MANTPLQLKKKKNFDSIIKLLEKKQKKELEESLILADAYLQTKEYEKCKEIYLELLRLNECSRFYMEIAKCQRLKGDFGTQTHKYLKRAIELSRAQDALIIHEYFAYLLDSSQITKKLILKHYQKGMFDTLKPIQHLIIASALFHVWEEELALSEALKIYYSEKRKNLLRFANLIFLLNKYEFELNDDEKSLLKIYKSVRFNQKKLKELIEQQSICVVGNSPCENGKTQGIQIDSFDLVARFNNYPSLKDKQFSNDYGNNSDIWMRSVGDWVTQRDIEGFQVVIISGLNLLARSTNWLYFKNYFSAKTIVTVIPNQYEKELITYLESPPSAGISLLYYIYKVQDKLDLDATFGFSFTDQLKDNFVNIGGTVAGGRHEWQKEKELFEKMMRKEI